MIQLLTPLISILLIAVLYYSLLGPLFIHMMGAILCLSFSASFHLFFVYSEKVHNFTSRLDYGGISLMIAGSTFPPIMYGFACYSTAKIVILSIVTIASVSAFTLTLIPGGDSPAFRTIRGILFFIAGVFAAVPITVATVSSGSFYYWMIGFAFYTIGVIFYVARIPERFSPGKFDYCVRVAFN